MGRSLRAPPGRPSAAGAADRPAAAPPPERGSFVGAAARRRMLARVMTGDQLRMVERGRSWASCRCGLRRGPHCWRRRRRAAGAAGVVFGLLRERRGGGGGRGGAGGGGRGDASGRRLQADGGLVPVERVKTAKQKRKKAARKRDAGPKFVRPWLRAVDGTEGTLWQDSDDADDDIERLDESEIRDNFCQEEKAMTGKGGALELLSKHPAEEGVGKEELRRPPRAPCARRATTRPGAGAHPAPGEFGRRPTSRRGTCTSQSSWRSFPS